MDIITILSTWARRWYVTVPILVVAGLIVWRVDGSTPTSYVGQVSVASLPPAVEVLEDPAIASRQVNAYGDSRSRLLMGALTNELDGLQGRQYVVDRNGTFDYTVELANSSPVINVAVESESRDAVIATLAEIVSYAQTRAVQLQEAAGAPPVQFLQVVSLGDIQPPTEVPPNSLGLFVAVGAAGLLASISAGVVVDTAVRRIQPWRARRRARRDGAAEDPFPTRRPERQSATADHEPPPAPALVAVVARDSPAEPVRNGYRNGLEAQPSPGQPLIAAGPPAPVAPPVVHQPVAVPAAAAVPAAPVVPAVPVVHAAPVVPAAPVVHAVPAVPLAPAVPAAPVTVNGTSPAVVSPVEAGAANRQAAVTRRLPITSRSLRQVPEGKVVLDDTGERPPVDGNGPPPGTGHGPAVPVGSPTRSA